MPKSIHLSFGGLHRKYLRSPWVTTWTTFYHEQRWYTAFSFLNSISTYLNEYSHLICTSQKNCTLQKTKKNKALQLRLQEQWKTYFEVKKKMSWRQSHHLFRLDVHNFFLEEGMFFYVMEKRRRTFSDSWLCHMQGQLKLTPLVNSLNEKNNKIAEALA